MRYANHSIRLSPALLATMFLLPVAGCDDGAAERAAIDKAEAQVRRIAEVLDKQTTDTGVYVRVQEDQIEENDPWGKQVQVSYSQGGVAEVVSVRSAGPDRQFHTDDDVVAQGMTANLKGIGEGVKQNAEETAFNAAKGFAKGTVEGVKESVKDALPFKTNDAADSEPKNEPAQQGAQPDREQAGESIKP